MYTYAYLFGALILGVFWLLIFINRRDLKKEILYGSFLGLPFGFSEFMFVPGYWDPPSLFDLIHTIGFGIESLLFAFFVGGISATIFEFFDRDKLVKMRGNHKTHLLPYIIVILLFIALEIFFPNKSIYNLSIALLSGALIIGINRPDLLTQIISSGIFFGIVYTLLFVLFMFLFPGYINHIYSLENLSGYAIFGVPIEETLFAISVGCCWSTFFEYMKSYKTYPIKVRS